MLKRHLILPVLYNVPTSMKVQKQVQYSSTSIISTVNSCFLLYHHSPSASSMTLCCFSTCTVLVRVLRPGHYYILPVVLLQFYGNCTHFVHSGADLLFGRTYFVCSRTLVDRFRLVPDFLLSSAFFAQSKKYSNTCTCTWYLVR